jgi:dTDP-4-dehydrorhamnose reductase
LEKIKPKRVLILGSTGMLGHVVYSTLNSLDSFEIIDVSYREKLNVSTIICDVNDLKKLEKIILEFKPDIIINCIGVLIQGTLRNIERAIFLNAYFPHWLKKLCNVINCKLIHISTDCVFSGNQGENSENTTPHAIDDYGRTKALGEFNLENHLCIRTSIIGPELKINGEGLLQWIFKQKGNVYGYKNVFWSGVTTLELSKAIVYAIENKINGLWNLTNEIEISKYDLIEKIITVFELSHINLLEDSKKFSNKSLISVRQIDYQVPSYSEMLHELKDYHN